MTRFGLLGTQSSTANALRWLVHAGVKVDALLALPPEWPEAQTAEIADYLDLRPIARELGVSCIEVGTYRMTDDATRARVLASKLDAIAVIGWQRLVPSWLIEATPRGVYGMHGSALPLPYGRGRSPMNWSIIEGRDRFSTHLIRYDAGADTGAVVDALRFDIGPWDTIRSLQHKNTIAQCRLLAQHLPAILRGDVETRPQSAHVAPSWYPRRRPEDGGVDWRWTATEIDRLVRAVAAPYPGAFTFDGEQRIEIHVAAPFDRQLDFGDAIPGTIVAVFTDGTFVVQCLQDTLYVTGWSAESWAPRPGLGLRSVDNRSHRLLAKMRIEAGND